MKQSGESFLFVCLLLIVLSGCAHKREKYANFMDGMVGKSIDHYVGLNGPPTSKKTLSDGKVSYLFERDDGTNFHFYGSGPYWNGYYVNPGAFSAGIRHNYCRTYVMADASNIILGWNDEGNACVANFWNRHGRRMSE